MENEFTPKLIEKAKQAKSAKELFTAAKENGVELSEEEAQDYSEQMNRSGELSDDDLDNISGGGDFIQIPDLKHPVVSDNHFCDNFKCRYCGSREAFMLMGSRVHWCGGNYIPSTCGRCVYKTYRNNKNVCLHPCNCIS